jgi:mRNA-degrading endonuclease RelE of RelBE toxin-antitoxin system
MRFIETSGFTRKITSSLSEDEYQQLQQALILRPLLGPAIPRTGGIRKLRSGEGGKGKRGGLRVIYYWHEVEATFYMLSAFSKNEQDDLTKKQERILRLLVEEEFS